MRVECPPMAVRTLGRLLVMIVAVLTLAVACGGRHNSAYARGTAVDYRLTADNAVPGAPGPANASTNAFGRVAQSNFGKGILKPELQPVDQLGSSGR